MIEGVLLPEFDDQSEPFWQGAAEGKLLVQACKACGWLRHPPRPMCPSCQSEEMEWREMSGRGTVWSFVVPHPPLLPSYQTLAPYNVIVVALDEDPGIRMIGNLLAREGGEINEVDPATIVIGEPVRVVYEKVADDVTLPRWVRA